MSTEDHFLEQIPSNSILVCTPQYTLIRLHIPIKAICVAAIADIKEGDRVSIEGVYQHKGETLAYQIKGIRLPYHHFVLQP